MNPSSANTIFVECPICRKQLKKEALARHLNQHQSATSVLDGIEIQGVDLSNKLKHFVVDESGILVNPNLIVEENQSNRDEIMGIVPLPNSKQKKQTKRGKAEKKLAKLQQTKSLDEIYREKEEWLSKLPNPNIASGGNPEPFVGYEQCPICKVKIKSSRIKKHVAKIHPGSQENAVYSPHLSLKERNVKRSREKGNKYGRPDSQALQNLVKCPLCNHWTQYNVLFTHIQVSHPEVNPKVVMAKFNRVNSKKDRDNLSKYQEELNNFVKDYERLKQGQDEQRDGGKYLGYQRREQGKFGSLPLYDDYSDESDSE